jgi:hypothetical protein
MAAPALFVTLGGVIVSALTAVLVNRIPAILMALGFSLVVYKGLDVIFGYAVSKIIAATGGVGVISYMGNTIDVFGMLGAAGVWSALNIVLSGYSALLALRASRVMVTKAVQ